MQRVAISWSQLKFSKKQNLFLDRLERYILVYILISDIAMSFRGMSTSCNVISECHILTFPVVKFRNTNPSHSVSGSGAVRYFLLDSTVMLFSSDPTSMQFGARYLHFCVILYISQWKWSNTYCSMLEYQHNPYFAQFLLYDFHCELHRKTQKWRYIAPINLKIERDEKSMIVESRRLQRAAPLPETKWGGFGFLNSHKTEDVTFTSWH